MRLCGFGTSSQSHFFCMRTKPEDSRLITILIVAGAAMTLLGTSLITFLGSPTVIPVGNLFGNTQGFIKTPIGNIVGNIFLSIGTLFLGTGSITFVKKCAKVDAEIPKKELEVHDSKKRASFEPKKRRT